MHKKHKKSVDQVLKNLDTFIQEVFVGKDRSMRRWILSATGKNTGVSEFKVYVRIPRGPVIQDSKGQKISSVEVKYKDVLDIASVEANPQYERMGSYFFDHVEDVAKGRNIKYIRVESVISPVICHIITSRGYVSNGCDSFWKEIT